MAETVGERLRTALALKGWNQSDLVRATGIDKNTVSAITNDKTQPRPATLSAMEAALELTPGTLAGRGEDASPVGRRDLTEPSDAELVAELGYRIEALRRRVRELEPLAKAEEERERARHLYLSAVGENSSDEDRWVEREYTMLVYKSHEEEWDGEDVEMSKFLDAKIDAMIFARDHNMVLVDRDAPELTTDPSTFTLAARKKKTSPGKQMHKESQLLGEESQDDGGDPV